MKLIKLTERVYITDYEVERDRPSLGYIKGDDWSLAVDAGHSKAHINEFYKLLMKENLPLPDKTVITHWHWDHSFAMAFVHGKTIAGKKTDEYLWDFISQRSPESDRFFFGLDPSIALEYEGQELVVVPADIVFEGKMTLDLGGITAELFPCVSAHTDDSTLVYIPEEKVLFFGDARSGTFPFWNADPVLLKGFIDTVEKIDAETFIGGHWDPYTKEDLLKELYESLEEETQRQKGESA